MPAKETDQYPEEEAQRRFAALVKAALNTPPEHKAKGKGGKPARKPKAAKGQGIRTGRLRAALPRLPDQLLNSDI
jgi:hypothetical protein